MSRVILVRNRQRVRAVKIPQLRKLVLTLLVQELSRTDFELSIYLVARDEMASLNEKYLGHRGSTDVITFDYRDPASPLNLAGEIFVCVNEAVEQATRFKVTWHAELLRYIAHGILHLMDYDDRRKSDRQKMKRMENRIMRLPALQSQLPSIELSTG